jgi:protein-S-isoprenylcysteine O-methyltransferase Ste14
MLLRRIEYEEKVLSVRFGKEYEEYASKTKKLIPFIY